MFFTEEDISVITFLGSNSIEVTHAVLTHRKNIGMDKIIQRFGKVYDLHLMFYFDHFAIGGISAQNKLVPWKLSEEHERIYDTNGYRLLRDILQVDCMGLMTKYYVSILNSNKELLFREIQEVRLQWHMDREFEDDE